ncbi:MAG: hypothetical protein V2I43_26680 [Parvularcula sp.]|nr:hypothetical protein [Parvularcula sp.]
MNRDSCAAKERREIRRRRLLARLLNWALELALETLQRAGGLFTPDRCGGKSTGMGVPPQLFEKALLVAFDEQQCLGQ